MSQFSAEQRLELLKSIRQQSANNDNLMNNRQQILMGNTAFEGESTKISTFKLRLLIAAMLFAGFFALTLTNQEKFQKTADTIVTEIQKDYDVVNSMQGISSKFLSDMKLE